MKLSCLTPALALVLFACGPATGAEDVQTQDAAADAPDALELDAQPEASAPEAGSPDVLSCTTDNDRDGHVSRACGGDDCDDDNRLVYPERFRPGVCSSLVADSNCDGTPDTRSDRNAGCQVECNAATGWDTCSFASTIVACIETDGALGCRACRGDGAADSCVCWVAGEMRTRTCAR